MPLTDGNVPVSSLTKPVDLPSRRVETFSEIYCFHLSRNLLCQRVSRFNRCCKRIVHGRVSKTLSILTQSINFSVMGKISRTSTVQRCHSVDQTYSSFIARYEASQVLDDVLSVLKPDLRGTLRLIISNRMKSLLTVQIHRERCQNNTRTP